MFASAMKTFCDTFRDGFTIYDKPLAIVSAKGTAGKVVIEDSIPAFSADSGRQGVFRLSSAGDHRRVLREAFQKAEHMVLVVSPFITLQAINADRIDQLAASAVSRGVKVVFVVDDELNRDANNKVKVSSLQAKAMLERSGARFVIARQIHNKTLCTDMNMIVEGSFNWLSAVRDPNGRYKREEKSIMCCGRIAASMVKDVIKEIGIKI